MSFDLFVIAPRIDLEVAKRFNELKHPGLPEGLSIDVKKLNDDETFWTMDQGGEEWLELYIDRSAQLEYAHKPADLAAHWAEVHIPSRGHPTVFHAVAAFAEAAGGWVFDPQGAAGDVPLNPAEDQAKNVEHGFYTPDITRQIGVLMATHFRWD